MELSRVRHRTERAVTLLGGGPAPREQVEAALALADEVLAADGGANVPLPAGYRLRAMFGDCDSVENVGRLRAAGVTIHQIAEQDTTDLEKCLYSVAAPLILGVGFIGGRVDHTLAALNVLVRYHTRRVVLLGREDVVFHCPARLSLALPEGSRVSFFPLRAVTGMHSSGLRWPVEGLTLAPGGRIGTSNRATGGRVEAAFDGPGAVVLLPKAQLGAVVEAMVSA